MVNIQLVQNFKISPKTNSLPIWYAQINKSSFLNRSSGGTVGDGWSWIATT